MIEKLAKPEKKWFIYEEPNVVGEGEIIEHADS